ncbi:MAG: hypothetical protein U9R54_03755 [Bacteroidota bacterium]|nr:hypothetical protein [Bacteroidota bacterium]
MDEFVKMHKNPFDIVFYVLKGDGFLTCEGESHVYFSFVAIEVKTEEMRAWKNESNEDFELIVIKIMDK